MDRQTSPAAAGRCWCARGCRGHQPEARDKDGGHWQPARHVPLEYAAWHRSVRERPRASPSCSAQTKPQFRFHPPGLHPQPGQRDKASSDSHGWRIKASGIMSVDSGGPACLPPCPPSCSMFCQSAGGGRADGLPEGLRGGYTPPSAPPAAPLPTQPCSPGAAPGPLRAAGVGRPLGTPRLGPPVPSSR